MSKHITITSVVIMVLLLLSGCSDSSTSESTGAAETASSDLEQAEQVLLTYFDELASGEYAAAAARFGGDPTLMRDSNPDIDATDLAALFEAACTRQLKCLPVRSIVGVKQSGTDSFDFRIEFSNQDGSLFVLGPCCGATETEMPPVSEFDCSVSKSRDSGFQVLCLPVYVP